MLRQDGEAGRSPSRNVLSRSVARPLGIVAEETKEDIPRVQSGQRTLLSFDAFPGRPLKATVSSVAPMGDPFSKTYRVTFRFARRHAARDGMTVEVDLVVRVAKATLLVPAGVVEDGASSSSRTGRRIAAQSRSESRGEAGR